MYPYKDELYHHGVKGMRWGVLRSRTAVLYDKHPGKKAQAINPSSKNPYEGTVYNINRAAKKKVTQANDIYDKTKNKLTNGDVNRAVKKKATQAKDKVNNKINNYRDKIDKVSTNSEGYKKTMKGNLHRLAAANYNLNAKVYKKSNKTLSSMNEAAAKKSLEKANAADKAAAIKRSKKKK